MNVELRRDVTVAKIVIVIPENAAAQRQSP
jgi:hypothetical protein